MNTRTPITASISLACVALAACAGGGGGDDPPELIYSFGKASQIQVDAIELSLEIRAEDLVHVSLTAPLAREAVRDRDVLRVWDVPLEPGHNELRLRATTTAGATFEQTLRVQNSAFPQPLVRLSLEPIVCEPGQSVRGLVHAAQSLGSPRAVLIDADRDGIIERTIEAGDPLEFVWFEPGLYTPRIAYRDARGMIHASSQRYTHTLRCLEPLTAEPEWSPPTPLPAIADVDQLPGRAATALLSTSERAVFHVTPDGRIRAQHSTIGCVQPVAIAVDPAGDELILDAATARLVRLDSGAGFMPDTTFGVGGFAGEHGAGPGQFDSPGDVVLWSDAVSGATRIVVADTGNARLQLLDEHGTFLSSLQAESPAPLDSPTQLEALAPGVVAVVDRGGRLRIFEIRRDGRSLLSEIHAEFGRIEATTLDVDRWTGDLFVGEATARRISIFSPLGSLKRSVMLEPRFAAAYLAHDDPTTRLVLVGEHGIAGYAWREDPLGHGPEAIARSAVERIVAGELDVAPVDPQFAQILAQWLAEPNIRRTLLAGLSALTEFRSSSASGDYALISAFASADTDEPDLVITVRRSPVDGAWLILHF